MYIYVCMYWLGRFYIYHCYLFILPEETIYARTANDQAILLETALMWQFVTIVVFLGK